MPSSKRKNRKRSHADSDVDVYRQEESEGEQARLNPDNVFRRHLLNGAGLWRAFRKTFMHPVNALIELLDNAADACTSPDGTTTSSRTRISQKIRVYVDNDIQRKSLIIANSSLISSGDIQKILMLFQSDKGASNIGENGIGTKQGML